jgi:hypothetical protein
MMDGYKGLCNLLPHELPALNLYIISFMGQMFWF